MSASRLTLLHTMKPVSLLAQAALQLSAFVNLLD